MRILVAIPTKSTIDAETAIAAANLDPCGHEVDYAYADGRGVYGVHQARNRVVAKALEGGYDYLFSIDSDTIVPPDAIGLLLDPAVDVCLGVYRYKNETMDCPFFKFVPGENGSDKWNWDEVPEGRFEVKQAGLGCALIKTDVFRSLIKPYFYWEERSSGCHTGEDIYFCNKAHAAGYKIWADGRVKCGHAGRKVYR